MNIVIAVTLLAMCASGLIFCLFMLARNSWVYLVRMAVLNDPALNTRQQLEQYGRFPEYNVMMWRVWVWDAKKFMR